VAGTSMPAWRDHDVDDLASIAAAVQALYASPDEAAVTPALEALGETVYAENCVQCHGATGDGQGSAAPELAIAPTDFTRQRPTLAASLDALRNGVAGTRMALWTDRLGADELLAVAHHVRGLYQGDAP
jgi:mono/diheme cytochrome c family protein